MAELRERCHRFLNSPAARNVHPEELFPYLRPYNILDEEEEQCIRFEKTLTKKQYCFFLKLLPTKGPSVKDIVHTALRKCGYLAAADEFARCTESDGYITPVEAEQFQASASSLNYFTRKQEIEIPPEPSAVYEEQGAGVPPYPLEDKMPMVRMEGKVVAVQLEKRTMEPQESQRQSPVRSVFRMVRTNLMQRAAPPAPSVPPEEPDIYGISGPPEPDIVEERFELAFSTGQHAPPPVVPRGVSSDLGSAGIPATTPLSFYGDTAPTFVPRERIEEPVPVEEGSLKASEIQLANEIGRGNFSVVYVAQYANRKVAVKKFRDYDEFSLAMFIEEVNIIKDLNHRNVVKYLGYVHSPRDRQLWLLTEFVAGGSMRRFCTPVGRQTQLERSLPLKDKAKIAVDCWQGLDYIHGKSLCHKDISPGNILVSNDLTQVKISDFGLAEFKNLVMTAMTQVSGTPMYYPPEFASESGVIRHPIKSDIYSMGASLCELFSEQWFWNLSGQPRNQFQVMYMLSEQQRLWTEKGTTKDPDCWDKVQAIAQPMLRDAITPDYKKRKSARELVIASQDLLKQLK